MARKHKQFNFKGIEEGRRVREVAPEKVAHGTYPKSASLAQTVAVLNRNQWLYLYEDEDLRHE